MSSIGDPVVQAVIQRAHALIFTDASDSFTTDFDLLLFYKVLEVLFRDREQLANFLTSDIQESSAAPHASEAIRYKALAESILAKPSI